MNEPFEVVLKRIVAKDPKDLLPDELEFLKARRMYLNTEQYAKFKDILGTGEPVTLVVETLSETGEKSETATPSADEAPDQAPAQHAEPSKVDDQDHSKDPDYKPS